VNERELRRALQRFDLPSGEDAAERSWSVVRAAFEEREPVPQRRRRLRPLLVLAALAALVAAALSSPGQALVDSVRDAIGLERAQPALFSLPAEGRLLVSSADGVWIVQADGTKRLLEGWAEAAWSPFGRFIVAARANELAALEDDGDVRWAAARPNVRLPRWGGTQTDTRIAYLSGDELRVIAGDGTGDRPLDAAVAEVPPAWRPGGSFVLAYLDSDRRVRVVDVESGEELGRSSPIADPVRIEWAAGGGALHVLTGTGLQWVDTRGRPVTHDAELPPSSPHRHLDLAAHPTAGVAIARETASGSEVFIGGRRVLAGPGRMRELAWSPDGEWLLVAWPGADQLVFVESAGAARIDAVGNVTEQFGGTSFPAIHGWCCRSSG
jgi:hypothetical protein